MNTGSSAASNSTASTAISLKPQDSDNVGWDYGVMTKPPDLRHVKCILCGKEMNGGIHRLKEHIAHIPGNVRACPKSTKEDIAKCLEDLNKAKLKKVQKRQRTEEVTNEVHILDDEEGEEEPGSRKNPHHLGPMDKFARQINPNATTRQPVINEALFKERSHHVHQYLARWLYESGIAFNAIDNDTFKQFCEALGQFGPGYRPPSQYLLREPLLKEEVDRTKNLLKKQEEWKVNGCSIMTDGWSDRKRRSVMNLCVNCKEGTTFVSSREDSESSHTGKYIFEYVDKHIDDIGPQNVVQVVTDNATNNMAAAELLKVKRPSIFWTSCATHTLNLMLEGIGKQPKFKGVIEKAKNLTIFIYAHTTTLALMRSHTKSREIIRPGVTRFATAFLTLQSINEKKEKLRLMFTSEPWSKNKVREVRELDSALEHRRSGRNAEVREVRELGEDDFESDDESEEENVIFDFESDGEGERVIIGLEDELV